MKLKALTAIASPAYSISPNEVFESTDLGMSDEDANNYLKANLCEKAGSSTNKKAAPKKKVSS